MSFGDYILEHDEMEMFADYEEDFDAFIADLDAQGVEYRGGELYNWAMEMSEY